MIKIIDFSPYYPPRIGGLEKYAEELHENLAKKNCQITVFVPHIPKTAPANETRPGINIIRYPAFEIIFNFPLPSFWKTEFRQQWKIIKKEKYDVAISTTRFFVQPLLAFFYAKKNKLPLLHIEHGSDYVRGTFLITIIARIFDEIIGRYILRNANKIIAPSKSAANFVKLLSKRKSVVIYRGMPFQDIDTILPEINLQKKYADKKIITFVGRLISGKGVINFLEAIRNLGRSDIIAFIVGYGVEKENLEEYAKRNFMEQKVIFLGKVPFNKAIAILKISNIFVNPSYNEGLPTSVLEAGACRKAIVATNVGGTPEIITHNQSGIIIDPHNTQAIQNALLDLLDDPVRCESLGQNARKEIESKFNWEKSVNAYINEINSLIKK